MVFGFLRSFSKHIQFFVSFYFHLTSGIQLKVFALKRNHIAFYMRAVKIFSFYIYICVFLRKDTICFRTKSALSRAYHINFRVTIFFFLSTITTIIIIIFFPRDFRLLNNSVVILFRVPIKKKTKENLL